MCVCLGDRDKADQLSTLKKDDRDGTTETKGGFKRCQRGKAGDYFTKLCDLIQIIKITLMGIT